MKNQNLYEKLAKLAVRMGVHVQKDQPLLVRANVRDVEFVRMVSKEAYEVGASDVIVDWSDEELSRHKFQYQSLERLKDIPDWLHDKHKYLQDKGICSLAVVSDCPGGLKDLDQEKISAYSRAFSEKMDDLMDYQMKNIGQWSIVALPSQDWAELVFPNLSPEEAYSALEKAIFSASRVDEQSNPEQNWLEHDARLTAYAKKMTDYQFTKLHFTSELGTDLEVGLVDGNIWEGGGTDSFFGIHFEPNIPTEEVFSMPHKDRVNGIVYASKPLSYSGKVIENFWFRFENGKVVEYGAEKEKEALDKLVNFDEGSSHLGEVALVPYNSPISQSGILYFNTLFDENAACHLALGRAYPENIQGGLTDEEESLKKRGMNTSLVHVDFMFGTKGMDVDGIQRDGTVVPVFRKGSFVIGE
ncbi:aminopeptidase [Bulleidia sp. zg-1006]|uniref:aminopeptidase n=1 Tax=Bulleidia sp. zg-1006 TaxID=2806552 RepID=UPI00193982F2|nr:aminopeptidase [Bulleidia sp. zg-1006]QRG86573.1 aminopeptidase [Bulleidia sp. zg-1006]